jgi:hypothetical protein
MIATPRACSVLADDEPDYIGDDGDIERSPPETARAGVALTSTRAMIRASQRM